MKLYISLFYVLVFILSFRKYKTFYNPITVFSLVWFIVTFLAQMRLFYLYETSDIVYQSVFVGGVAFTCGAVIKRKNKLKIVNNKSNLNFDHNKFINVSNIDMRFVWMLSIIALVFTTLDLINILPLYFRGVDMQGVRTLYSEGEISFSNNALYLICRNYIVKPFVIMLIPIAAIDFFGKEKKKYGLILISLFILIAQTISEAGRMGIIEWLAGTLIVYLMMHKGVRKNRISLSAKVKIVFFICVAVLIFLNLSNLRGINDFSRNIYIYLCGCMPHYSILVKKPTVENFYALGFASFYGLTSCITWILSIFGIYPTFFNNVSKLCAVQDYVYIAPNIRFNAFVSAFYYAYQDGKMIGVVIIMFIYGYFCEKIYLSMEKINNDKYICLYTLVFIGLVFTFVRFPFAASSYLLAFIYTYIVFSKKRKKSIFNNK